MPAPSVFVVADDLTGACDTGVQFVDAGLTAAACIDIAAASDDGAGDSSATTTRDVDVLVWDSETRNGSAAEAAEAVSRAVASAPAGALLFKKVDSTLRGHMGPELLAMAAAAARSPLCVVAPAFPEAGRTTVGGHQLLDGKPVHRAAVAKDGGAPVTTSDVRKQLLDGGFEHVSLIDLTHLEAFADAAALAAHLRSVASATPAGRVHAVVIDAAAPEDLSRVARACKAVTPTPILCGSAGLAGHVAHAFELTSGAAAAAADSGGAADAGAAATGPPIVACCTAQPHTAQQLDNLRSRIGGDGLREFDLGASGSGAGAGDADPIASIAAVPPRPDDVVLLRSSAMHAGSTDAEASAAVESVAKSTAALVASTNAVGFVASGGWTAVSILRELGASAVDVVRSVQPGVPLCRISDGSAKGVHMVSKAGGLGNTAAITDAVAALRVAAASGVAAVDKPIIAITMGDPCGIGPEICAKTLADPRTWAVCRPMVVGHPHFLQRELARLKGMEGFTVHEVASIGDCTFDRGSFEVWSPVAADLDKIVEGEVCPEAGRIAVEFVKAAAQAALRGDVAAVCTAPLNKESFNKAGFHFAGHTELLASETGAKSSRLSLVSDELSVVHVTGHISTAQIVPKLTGERIDETVRLAHEFMQRRGKARARIAVAALNPHASDGGLFGDQEEKIIAPAVERAKAAGINAFGPVPADTCYLKAYQGKFDFVIAMYHDQGHIPVKLVGFDTAVNVTLGLPIIRTSVDHGTAFDIAGRGIADHNNLLQAARLAADLAAGPKPAPTASD